MCGIIGVASRSPSPIDDRAWLGVGRDAMSHRGPDDVGEWWSETGCVGFGHRRLSIIDLTPGGHQPMHDESGALTVVYNGEIYNHQEVRDDLERAAHVFRTRCDTEVLLAAYRQWDVDCLARLSGMYAFAVYDGVRNRLFLARDRAGEKPLFYVIDDSGLRFASELKGLMADPSLPRRIDREAMDCYLAAGFVPGDRCILERVRKLPAAHAMTFDLGSGALRVWRYWTPPEVASNELASGETAEELVDEVDALLEDSVRKQLVADVPVGILLSGGVDSSLVTAMAARCRPSVKTFTVRFPGYGRIDETKHARLVARHFGTEHVELEASDAKVDVLPLLARQFDEPMVDSSMVPTFFVTRLIREQCSVALGGDGGDELFGGYNHYNRLLWLQSRLGRVPRRLRAPIASFAERALPIGFRGRNWLLALSTDFHRDVPLVATHFDRRTRGRLMGGGVPLPWLLPAEDIRRERTPCGGDLLQRATRLDFENYLPDDILVKVDRASMLNSLEVRAPFLDHRIVEFAFGRVPSRLKTTSLERKILLKRLAKRILPETFDSRRKQGFAIPLASWLDAGPWRGFFREVLLDRDTVFDRTEVRRILDDRARSRSNGERLFALVMFELWRREYRAFL